MYLKIKPGIEAGDEKYEYFSVWEEQCLCQPAPAACRQASISIEIYRF